MTIANKTGLQAQEFDQHLPYRLRRRMARALRRKGGEVLPTYVVAVSISRCYGGPEEGGWWYNWTDIEEVRRAWDWKTIRAYLREYRDTYEQPRFDIYSAANDGPEYRFLLLDDPNEIEEWQTTERPTYE
jgi:hypothetical protein